MENLFKLIWGGGVDCCNIKLFTSTDCQLTQYSKFYENLKEVSFFFLYIFRARDLDLEFQFRILTSALGKIYIHYI